MQPPIDHEQVMWLKALLSSYQEEHNWDADEDPSATLEMLMEVGRLCEALEQQHPEPAREEVEVSVSDEELPF